MTGNVRRSGPPWSVDLLADLHAGVLDPQAEAELRAAVAHDPEAQDVLAALDATVTDLRDLPPIPMPRAVADRIDAALAEEFRRVGATPAQQPPAGQHLAPVVDLAARRRKKQLGWGAGLLAAAAVAVGVVVVTTQGTPASNPGDNVAQPKTSTNTPVTESRLAVKGNDFGPVFGDVLKAQNYGPLENQEKLAGCLQGANIASAKPLGVSPITLDGKGAVMAILPGGKPGAFKIVVLDPDTCGPDNPNGVLATSQITP